ADVETDEVYAQMTLQPLNPQEQKDTFLPVELGIPSRQPTNYFCKTLTASDTSTHGGFSVLGVLLKKFSLHWISLSSHLLKNLLPGIFMTLNGSSGIFSGGSLNAIFLQQGGACLLVQKDLLQEILFFLSGIRRANRPQTVMPSSVLSSDSMHIGLLAAASHAAATSSCFTIFYNPRASPSEFVIPLSKYVKAMYNTRVSVGMRFRMLFETEESSVRRYMGTITGVGDLDPVRWPNSHWRSVK
ncbi:hypothetical protein M8C21_006371, partial [Ambrosia artemisiifolia]